MNVRTWRQWIPTVSAERVDYWQWRRWSDAAVRSWAPPPRHLLKLRYQLRVTACKLETSATRTLYLEKHDWLYCVKRIQKLCFFPQRRQPPLHWFNLQDFTIIADSTLHVKLEKDWCSMPFKNMAALLNAHSLNRKIDCCKGWGKRERQVEEWWERCIWKQACCETQSCLKAFLHLGCTFWESMKTENKYTDCSKYGFPRGCGSNTLEWTGLWHDFCIKVEVQETNGELSCVMQVNQSRVNGQMVELGHSLKSRFTSHTSQDPYDIPKWERGSSGTKACIQNAVGMRYFANYMYRR